MRNDALGLFWEDIPVVKVKKEVIKRTPPEPVWENEDYLPYLDEAIAFNVDLFTDDQLYEASRIGEELVYDIESYPNYFCIAFKGVTTKKVVFLELLDPDHSLDDQECQKLKWILESFCIVGFYSRVYDITMAAMAISGQPVSNMNIASNMLVQQNERPAAVRKYFKIKALKNINHIDLIDVAPLSGSLKQYGGRLHTKRMQDLPFPPQNWLTRNQQHITLYYCVNDLDQTLELRVELEAPLRLRDELGAVYKTDLRSRSDAQIAEDVITREVRKLTGRYPKRPEFTPGLVYNYQPPHFIRFQTPLMNGVLTTIMNTPFELGESGKVALPDAIKGMEIVIGNRTYKLGIGGLHSQEKCAAFRSGAEYTIYEHDVTSYYPFIILNLGLYPSQLGKIFLHVYRTIVERRLAAKASGDKKTADSLKITINGSFGKFGSQYSNIYSPSLLIQTTVTGQLSLLMLIEAFELNGIPVVSGNTDGVMVTCPKGLEPVMEYLIKDWEWRTGFNMETGKYEALFSRDVNNYIAIEEGGKDAKIKGIFSKPGLSKNPNNWICIEAVRQFLLKGVLIQDTITQCKDIRPFVTVRNVRGGGVKVWEDSTEFLGKTVRWYYAKDQTGELVYAKSGNKVPRSDGAKPLMNLPASFPEDIDYNWYITESYSILEAAGYFGGPMPENTLEQALPAPPAAPNE